MEKRKTMSTQELLQLFSDSADGTMTVQRLSSIFMQPVKKDETIDLGLNTVRMGMPSSWL